MQGSDRKLPHRTECIFTVWTVVYEIVLIMEENQQVRLKYYIRWYFILGKSVGKIGLSQLLE